MVYLTFTTSSCAGQDYTTSLSIHKLVSFIPGGFEKKWALGSCWGTPQRGPTESSRTVSLAGKDWSHQLLFPSLDTAERIPVLGPLGP